MNEENQEAHAYQIELIANGMTHSPTLFAIGAALAAAQGEMSGAIKDAQNPYFKSAYANLASVIGAIRGPLAKNKIAHIQVPGHDSNGAFVDTMLIHASGEWIRGRLYMKPVKNDPQGLGSAISYARRYSLQSIVGLEAADDDGNEASQTQEPPKPEPKKYRQAGEDPAIQARIAKEEAEFAAQQNTVKAAMATIHVAQGHAPGIPVMGFPNKTGYPEWCDYIKDCGSEFKGETLASIALNHPDRFKTWVETFAPKPSKAGGPLAPSHIAFREALDAANLDPLVESELVEVIKLQEARK